MASQIAHLLPPTQLKLSKNISLKHHLNSMWNPNQAHEDDDSWEVRAFEEDARNVMGSTWPPRSYTCTFCRREFRSAQALGGHMNVHRRDRARLNQTPPIAPNSISNSSSTFIIPAQEFSSSGGLCLFYPLPNPNSVFASTTLSGCPKADKPPPTLLSISQYPNNYHHQHRHNLRVASPVINSSHCYSNCKAELPRNCSDNSSKEFTSGEEVDLELRLGHGSTSSSSSS